MNQFKHKETYIGKIFDVVVGSKHNPGFACDWGPIKVHKASNQMVYYSYFSTNSSHHLKSINAFEDAINNKVIVEKKN